MLCGCGFLLFCFGVSVVLIPSRRDAFNWLCVCVYCFICVLCKSHKYWYGCARGRTKTLIDDGFGMQLPRKYIDKYTRRSHTHIIGNPRERHINKHTHTDTHEAHNCSTNQLRVRWRACVIHTAHPPVMPTNIMMSL